MIPISFSTTLESNDRYRPKPSYRWLTYGLRLVKYNANDPFGEKTV
ncbi:hypothetical protein [Larkinella arboricola]|nr:hypothetical protein [Larkinella arboricola]